MDCPVQTRMPVAVGEGATSVAGGLRECQGLKSLMGKQQHTCRRRVFVQTDSGSVLGIELDRSDNAQTVKKKMQMALNVPAQESSLTFGDMVLKSDLSVVRNDAPLRLTRSIISRSSSTPCLPLVTDSSGSLQRDKSGPLEIIGGLSCCTIMKKVIKQAVKAIERGVDPVPAKGGLGGAYFFRNIRGENIAIVKPTDEEPLAPNNPKGFVGKCLGLPGLKRSVRVGETGVREVAAYLLDHDHFAKVPPTVLVKISHSVFNVNSDVVSVTKPPIAPNPHQPVSKIASLQRFVFHDFDASDHGTSSFSVSAVHRIGILDVRILNTDRHGGNILVKTPGRDFSRHAQVGDVLELVPIDHGLCLPETLDDPYFEWLHWPQSSLPFSDEELEYIDKLDANKDADMLRMELPMLRESSLRILVLCTIFLKVAAKSGLCLAEIGEMMSRDLEEASELELICLQAKLMLDEQTSPKSDGTKSCSEPASENDLWSEAFDFDMESDEALETCNEDKMPACLDSNAFVGLLKDFDNFNPFEPSSGGVLQCNPGRNDLLCKAIQVNPNGFSSNHLSSPRSLHGNSRMSLSITCSSPRTPRGCPLSKLEEVPSLEGEDVDEEGDHVPAITTQRSPPAQQLMVSPGNTNSGEFRRNFSNVGTWKGFSKEGLFHSRPTQSGHELSVVTSKGITFSEMSESEWSFFLKCFQELLPEAFASRQRKGSSQRQRLGTSCQF
eukprot:TRINITY_DN911_c0_g1_i1.p1 TRINITY_DN911_c0_g1~~TRINITY_DN911_c0_g1_i1.p1  ORF type:complete len:722 (-),score=149.56 TRINITY_DN911_c0_g1_i1:317-2482(-)